MKANGYTIKPGAYLWGANLWGADLRGANLRGADLRGAYLRDAYLRDANFRHADFRGANLRGADLRGVTGVLSVPVSDLRTYRWLAVAYKDGWMIAAGCHWFTLDEARAHWLSPDYKGPDSVKQTVGAALDWVEAQPLPDMEGE